MYIPKHYLMEDTAECVAFMRRYSFATIVTATNNVPFATHLPFIIEMEAEKITLTAHFAKANPQWQHLAENEALVVFQEPHAYISPTHYESEPNVPTWDYIAVHAYGKGEIIEKPDAIEKLILQHEPFFLEKWNGYTEDYRRKLFNGIVAFRIEVTRLEGKKKLNQKSSEGERESIAVSLENRDLGVEKDLAEYIRNQ